MIQQSPVMDIPVYNLSLQSDVRGILREMIFISHPDVCNGIEDQADPLDFTLSVDMTLSVAFSALSSQFCAQGTKCSPSVGHHMIH